MKRGSFANKFKIPLSRLRFILGRRYLEINVYNNR